jgi:hypothetical protein
LTVGCLAGCGMILFGLAKANLIELPDAVSPDRWLGGKQTALAAPPSPSPTVQAKANEQKSPQASPAANAASKAPAVLGQAQSPVPPADSIAPWLKAIQEVKLEAGARFSVNDWVKQVMKTQKIEVFEQDLSYLSCLLYEAGLKAGLEAGDRYLHKELPAYANPGFDVSFEPDREDLTLLNPWDFPIQVGVSNAGSPVLQLTGTASAKWAAAALETAKEAFPADKIVVVDYSLTGGGEVKRQDGKEGYLIKVYKAGKDKEPKTLLYKDYYAPIPWEYGRAPSADELKTAGK